MKNITLILALISIINTSCNSDDCMGMSKSETTEFYERVIGIAEENGDERQKEALEDEFERRLNEACD